MSDNIELTLANLKKVKILVLSNDKKTIEFGVGDADASSKNSRIIDRGPAGVGMGTEFHCDTLGSAVTIIQIIEAVTGHQFRRMECISQHMDVFVRDDHHQYPGRTATATA